MILFSEHTLQRLRRKRAGRSSRGAAVRMKGKRNHVAVYALDRSARRNR